MHHGLSKSHLYLKTHIEQSYPYLSLISVTYQQMIQKVNYPSWPTN